MFQQLEFQVPITNYQANLEMLDQLLCPCTQKLVLVQLPSVLLLAFSVQLHTSSTLLPWLFLQPPLVVLLLVISLPALSIFSVTLLIAFPTLLSKLFSYFPRLSLLRPVQAIFGMHYKRLGLLG
jgi:hypothetical protein